MASHISWSSYCASQRGSSNQQPCLTSFLPLFKDDSKSGTILYPGLDIIKRLTFLLNPTQNSVVTMDEPLYTITKQVQWCVFFVEYEKDNLIVLLGGLHEEKASFSMLGVIIKESGWVELVSEANVFTSGRLDSFLLCAYITRRRYGHCCSYLRCCMFWYFAP